MADEEIQFGWNEDKAASNLVSHGVSFETATYAFDDPFRLEEADVFARGEYRSIVIGRVDQFVLTVVYAEPEEGSIRIISARLATPEERRAYERNIFHP